MISQRKLEANRRNAEKSTGPRTAEGKAKVRLNAVTHGLTSTTVVLPHEDEQAYQHRLEAWTTELKPPGELGRYLVERVVRISWQLDRADTFERAKLARRIQDAPRNFGASDSGPAETLIARLLGMEAQPNLQTSGPSHGSQRLTQGGPAPDGPLAPLLRELESSAEGCRRLIAEWTGIVDWLGQLGPEGIVGSDIRSRLEYVQRALALLGVRIADDVAVAATTADRLAGSFLRTWQLIRDQAILELFEQDTDEDNDPPSPDGPELAPGLAESRWAAVSVALGKLATERCTRLNNLLARHDEGGSEARSRLAYEASFDDSPEGERLHRYQARWGRSLLRTLAALDELRGCGSPTDEEDINHACTLIDTVQIEERSRSDPGEEALGRQDHVGNFTSEVISSNGGAGLGGGGREAVIAMGSAAGHEEKRQNKPNAVTRTVVNEVEMASCVERPDGRVRRKDAPGLTSARPSVCHRKRSARAREHPFRADAAGPHPQGQAAWVR